MKKQRVTKPHNGLYAYQIQDIPGEMRSAVKQAAKEEGKTQSQWVRDVMTAALSSPRSAPSYFPPKKRFWGLFLRKPND